MGSEMLRLSLVVIAVVALNSCASGSAVVTGTKRQGVDTAIVQMYSTPPSEYEVIGVVKASSEMGLTEQQSMNYAVEELKKQAAAIGANGLLVTEIGGRSEDAAIAAQAIFVKK